MKFSFLCIFTVTSMLSMQEESIPNHIKKIVWNNNVYELNLNDIEALSCDTYQNLLNECIDNETNLMVAIVQSNEQGNHEKKYVHIYEGFAFLNYYFNKNQINDPMTREIIDSFSLAFIDQDSEIFNATLSRPLLAGSTIWLCTKNNNIPATPEQFDMFCTRSSKIQNAQNFHAKNNESDHSIIYLKNIYAFELLQLEQDLRINNGTATLLGLNAASKMNCEEFLNTFFTKTYRNLLQHIIISNQEVITPPAMFESQKYIDDLAQKLPKEYTLLSVDKMFFEKLVPNLLLGEYDQKITSWINSIKKRIEAKEAIPLSTIAIGLTWRLQQLNSHPIFYW